MEDVQGDDFNFCSFFFFAWVLLDIDVPSVLIMSVNHYLIKE